MFYRTRVKDHIRVPPNLFGDDLDTAIIKMVKGKYEGFISNEFGIVIDVSKVNEVGTGVVIPGDGASYYEAEFELLTFKPEMQEVVLGKIKDIADFGAFISIGPVEGMIHISQTMDDFVSLSKDKVLLGKDTKRSIKVNDLCRARIVAISFKDATNPKLGLTMRQAGLGKVEWAEEDLAKKASRAKPKEEKEEKAVKEKKKKE